MHRPSQTTPSSSKLSPTPAPQRVNHSTLDNIPIFFLFVFVSLCYREAEHTLAVLIVMLTEKSTVTMAAESAASKMVTTTGVAASSK
jgi:hypothetical protein